MALFSDGPISDTADLQRYENAILNVASGESIDLGAKLMLAQQDLGNELLLFLFRRSSLRDYSLDFRRSRGVKDVVVTDPMRKWHVHRTLSLVYRDAYNNQLNDRYQGKWAEYESLAKASAQTYFQIGVGLVADPVPKAATPILSSVEGTAAGRCVLRVGNLGERVGQEGAPSDFATLVTTNGQQLRGDCGSDATKRDQLERLCGNIAGDVKPAEPGPTWNKQQLDDELGSQSRSTAAGRPAAYLVRGRSSRD